MKLLHVRARQGARWVNQGLRVFFRRPLAFCGLMLLCLLLAPLLLFAMAPLASLGFMIATGQSLQGRFPLPGVFVEPLRISRRRLYAHMKLCLLYAAGITIVFWLARAIGGAAIDAVMQAVAAGKTSVEELEPLLSATDFQLARFVLLAAPASRCCQCHSGTRRRSCIGAIKALPRPCSSAPSRVGATKARSRSTC
ncbi:MAG: hypothetical protein E6H65_07995 [Betaproteobacteria bacterium]|nr:MAG: hypothetical protein E6H65_07995 [Betaproteobacteria bacterium]